jgi:hypothetical protein
MDTVKDRFPKNDFSLDVAMWIWDTIIVPLQAELKEAEEKAEDAISGWPDGYAS